jgi:DNA-3-methyladenine glycosylase II
VQPSFGEKDFHQLCHKLARKDAALRNIIKQYGYPPLWGRKAVFETLVHIILEQQVSLASAKAALNKLKEKIGSVTPAKLLLLTDAELKACYFSRQKTGYVRGLAEAIQKRQLKIAALSNMPDEQVRQALTAIKGIGHWTTDVYLMMVLHRPDLFPTGDVALMNSMRFVKKIPDAGKEELLALAENWRPYRTIAAYLLWHAYIQRKGIVF